MKFIIYAPRYDEAGGGSIVLHKLCDILNRTGNDAYLWPMGKPCLKSVAGLRDWLTAGAYYGSRLYRKAFVTSRRYQTPMAGEKDINGAIVVYPETISGNPLGAKQYVRWFLHRPGFHIGEHRYSPGDLYFYYLESFDVADNGLIRGGKLTVAEYFTDVYQQRNHGSRDKVCYMIRKGGDRSDLPSFGGIWIVDDLGHEEMARAFNECSRCYFYDTYTMYSTYAALCGCVPIVVPETGISREEWMPEERYHYGIAYGEEDVSFAVGTRDLMVARLARDEERNWRSVQDFLQVVRLFFKVGNHLPIRGK